MAIDPRARDQAVSAMLKHYEFSERLLLGLMVVGAGASIAGATSGPAVIVPRQRPDT